MIANIAVVCRWVVGLILLSACGPSVAGVETSGGSSSTGDVVDPSMPGGSTSGTDPTSASSSTSSSTGAHDTSSSDGSSTGEPALSICDPQPTGPSLPMLIDGMEVYDTAHLDLVDSCQIDDVRMEGEFLVLDFVCAMGPISVSVTAPTLPDLAPGDMVELSLFVDSPWWGNAYVKVTRDGMLHLAAMAGEALPSGGEYDPPVDFFAPLTHTLLMDACEPEPAPEDGGSSFLGDGDCTRDRRLAIDFGIDGDTTTVFDHDAGTVGDLSVQVGRTVHYEEISCTDTPSGWREFIAVRPLRVAKR